MSKKHLERVELVQLLPDSSGGDEVLLGSVELSLVVAVSEGPRRGDRDALRSVLLSESRLSSRQSVLHSEKGVALRLQTDELVNRVAVRLVFELPDDLLVGLVEEATRFRIRREVESVAFGEKVFIEIVGLNAVHEGIGVRVEQLRARRTSSS